MDPSTAPQESSCVALLPKSSSFASIAFPELEGLDQMQGILVHALEATSDSVNSSAVTWTQL